MKIISQDSCRVTILFPLEEVIPLGGMNGPEAISKIQQRYEFLKTPDPGMTREEAAKAGYKFGTGQIPLKGKKNVVVEFAIYTDGIVADARNSETAEIFLDDVIHYMQSEFEFRQFNTEPKKYFWNQLIVEFEKPLGKLFPSLEKISGAISRYLNIDTSMNLARFDLQAEKGAADSTGPSPKLVLERRIGVPFKNERYYSSAPLRTRDHVAVLEEIERLIG